MSATKKKTLINTHISKIRAGDVILCEDGHERTLSESDIKRDTFMGTTILGDSYRLGQRLVRVVSYVPTV